MDAQKRKEFIERFELDPTKKAGTYSKGNRLEARRDAIGLASVTQQVKRKDQPFRRFWERSR